MPEKHMPLNSRFSWVSPGLKSFLSDYRLTPFFVALGLLLVAVYVDQLNLQKYQQEQRFIASQNLAITKAQLEGNIGNNIQAIKALVAAVESEPLMSQARYSQLAKYLLNNDNQLKVIAMAPDLIISMTHPLLGNEKTIGFDYRSNAQQLPGVLIARDSKQLVLAGPIDLVQGGKAFIVRVPMYFERPSGEEYFWGVASAVIDSEALFASSGMLDPSLKLDLAIQGVDDRFSGQRIFFGNADIVNDDPVTTLVKLPFGYWKIYGTPKQGWPTQTPNATWHRLVMFMVILLICLPLLLSNWLRRKRSEESRRLQSLFKLSPVGIVLTDFKSGKFLNCNPSFLNSTHYSLKELKKMPFHALTPKEGYQPDTQSIKKILDQGHYGPIEKEILTKDGECYPAVLNGLLSSDDKGRPYVWSFIVDISASKNAEQKILEQKQTLELVIDNTSVGIWDWNIKTGALIVNERWVNIIGYTLAELTPITIDLWNEHAHPDDLEESNRLLHECWQKPDQNYMFEARVFHKNGDVIWVLDSGKVVQWDDDGSPVRMVGTHVDITNQKKSEQALLNALEKSKQAELAKSEFLAAMSHEIRTPMNGVLGMLELLSSSALSVEQAHKVNIAQSSANSLLSIIDGILDFSKMEAGKLDFEKNEFNLRDLIDNCAESLALKAQEKGLELVINNVGIQDTLVMGDPNRIKQIIINLLGNAVKFTHHGVITITSKLSLQDSDYLFECEVRDTGIGIPPEKLTTLFTEFTQVDASTTREYGGTGLGLAISKKLTQLMQGEISLSSQVGVGSAFNISLKLYLPEHKQSCQPQTDLSSAHFLIIDHNESSRTALKDQLVSWGASVTACESWQHSRHQLADQSHQYIMINSLDLPTDDSALSAIKANQPANNQLVLMTPMNFVSNASHHEQYDCILPKPITSKGLLHMIDDTAAPAVSTPAVEPDSDTLQWPSNSKILLVEDIPFNQEVAAMMLEELGLSADIAENGQVAINMLKADPNYTFILMDCQMPVMDGFEATQGIRQGLAGEHHKHIFITALTANALTSDKDKCTSVGMDSYLSKPLDINRLKNVLINFFK